MILELNAVVTNLLLGMLFVGLCVTFLAWFQSRKLAPMLQSVLAILLVGMVLAVVSKAGGKGAAVMEALVSFVRLDRQAVLAFVAGIAISIGLYGLKSSVDERKWFWRFRIASLVVANLIFGLFLVLLYAPQYISGRPVKDARYDIERVFGFDDEPICVCVDEQNNVFVSAERYLDGREEGRVFRIHRDGSGAWKSTMTVGAQGLLNRPFGLAWHEGALYVSRAGRSIHATDGGLVYDNTGAVTKCRDLDGDGVFESFVDVVDQIPGFGGPDSQHGNNGIVFGKNNEMFLCVGTPTNRALVQKQLEGTVLRFQAGSKEPEIFARGFRNPFGICMNSRDEIFVTDNDCDENPGDEINFVVQGEHYGHPYVIPGEHEVLGGGFTEPLYVGGKYSNLVGIAFLEGDRFPPDLQDSLLVTDIAADSILILKVDRTGGKLKLGPPKVFATVRRPVGLVVANNGDIYVIARRPSNSLFRISRK